MAMHVVQLGPYPPPEGGISRNMLAIREEVLARGNTCSIIATSRSSRESDEPNVYHPHSSFALLRLLATMRFDILHLHVGGDVSPRVLSLALAASIFGRGKSVLTLHSGAYPATQAGVSAKPNSIRGLVFRKFSRIISVNMQLADVFRRYGVSADRIKVIAPHSLRAPDESVAVPPELAEFCARHSPVLLAVGGLEKDYDPLFQIGVMPELLQEFPNAGLMIVGDGSLRKDVETAVASTGTGMHICIAGNVEHAVTLHLITRADILLRTTLFDGDAISIREALFLGTPVIATYNGMRPDGTHLIEIGDVNALVTKVKEIVAAEKQSLGSTISDDGNIQAIVDLYGDLF